MRRENDFACAIRTREAGADEKERRPIMPTWRKKPANRQYVNKRHTPQQQQEQRSAAKAATQRLYCDALELWRGCAGKTCRRHLRCMGDPAKCLDRGLRNVPRWRQDRAAADVLAGGPRRIAPANHKEWAMRRTPLSTIAG
jgi:hypothetical protein